MGQDELDPIHFLEHKGKFIPVDHLVKGAPAATSHLYLPGIIDQLGPVQEEIIHSAACRRILGKISPMVIGESGFQWATLEQCQVLRAPRSCGPEGDPTAAR